MIEFNTQQLLTVNNILELYPDQNIIGNELNDYDKWKLVESYRDSLLLDCFQNYVVNTTFRI